MEARVRSSALVTSPRSTSCPMFKQANRRDFLANCAKALGGMAMIGTMPRPIFAVRQPRIALHDEFIWSMGTQVRLSVPRDAFAPRLYEEAFSAIREVDKDLTIHRQSSELSQLNANPGSWRAGSRTLLQVSQAALRFGDLTGGALDVTVLPILRRLGFAPSFVSEAGAVREVVDYTKLRVRNDRILLESGGYAVDFGGIAKGFAVDEALAGLRASGIDSGLIDAGGDLYAFGRPETDRKWRIGIRDPFRPDSLFATIEVEDEAVATSGTYAQTRVIDGVRQSHIVDPKTGRSVTEVVSATVLSRSTMSADALATAISVMTPEAAKDLIGQLPETEAVWVFADGTTAVTEGLRGRIHLL